MPRDTFNDRMVKKTVVPVIYLWMLASAAVVGMGIFQPDVVLANLDGFIALIAIIGGTAAPALNTLMRMWSRSRLPKPPRCQLIWSIAASATPQNMNIKCSWNPAWSGLGHPRRNEDA